MISRLMPGTAASAVSEADSRAANRSANEVAGRPALSAAGTI